MKLACVQVRGPLGMHPKLRDTLAFLKLVRKNSCVVLDNSRNSIGMLVKLKDYVTWGEIDQETLKQLIEKRARIVGNKALSEDYLKSKINMNFAEFAGNVFNNKIRIKDVAGLKTFFRLTPPRGGFEKMGIKKQYSIGGALGYRGQDINNLIRRML